MGKSPEIPLDKEAQIFNRLVEELVPKLRARFPDKSEAELIQKAQERIAPEFYQL